jgi:FtsZ-binding cell division protein ZapB
MKRENTNGFSVEEMTPWPVKIEQQLRQAVSRIAALEADVEELKDRRLERERLANAAFKSNAKRKMARKAARS